jgi:Tol biopolymer transport system component
MFRQLQSSDKSSKYHFILTAFCACLLLFVTGCGQKQSNDLLGEFTLDVPIAYVKRPIVEADNITPLGNPRNSFQYAPGGNLYYRAVASASSPEINITGALTAIDESINKDTAGDVSDPDVSYDGTKIVFSMKIGEFTGVDPEDQPTWNIWEYDITTGDLHRVINGDIKAEEGNDFDPSYLPDGRIVFASDRQSRTKQFFTEYGFGTDSYLDEDRREPAVVLHVMDASGENIQQISYNQSHDLNPSVLSDGRIIYSRWEHASGKNQFDIFHVNPDGTGLNVLYGAHSHAADDDNSADVFLHPREMPDGRLISTLMPRSGTFEGGDLVLIDYQNYADINTAKIINTSNQATGQVSVSDGAIPLNTDPSSYGRYTTPFPLWDGTNRLLASWTPCLAQLDNGDPNIETNPVVPCPSDMTGYVQASEPLYHIVIMDLDKDTQNPIVRSEPGMAILQPVALVDRSLSLPRIIPDKSTGTGELDTNMKEDEVGAIKIRSVYDTLAFSDTGMQSSRLINNEMLPCDTADFSCADGDKALLSKIANPDYVTKAFNPPTVTTVPRRPARFVRIVTAVQTPPDIPRFAYGVTGQEMRAIAGYAPVEPDGSVYVEVPADTPFAVEVLDDRGRKFGGHNDWMQVRPGETIECNGCHNSHDGSDSINSGASMDGTPFFSNTNPTMSVADATNDVYVPRAGDTMAEARVRLSCETGDMFCDARKLQSGLVFDDVWTDPAVMTPQASYAIQYKDFDLSDGDDGLATPYPIINVGPASDCLVDPLDAFKPGDWTSRCRIVINYLEHIQPLWDLPRPQYADAAKTVPLLDSMGNPVDYRCTSCHTSVAADGMTPQVPPGDRQLDLTTDGSTTGIRNRNDDWNTSYQELLSGKLERELDDTGALVVAQDCSFQDTDNDPTTPDVEVCVDRPLSTGSPIVRFSARRSYLIEKLTETELGAGRSLTPATDADYVDHSGMMTTAEIRLISEWIDLGVPYYSNPFDVPQ